MTPARYGAGVYKITCTPNGKAYVGSSATSISKRWVRHLNDLRKGVHHSWKLQKDYIKYGPDAFAMTVLLRCGPAECTLEEQAQIDLLRPRYNVCPQAISCLGVRRSPETRAKMSASATGKSPTPETRAKLSEANRGKSPTPETRAKLSAAALGKKRPNISLALTGRKRPDVSVRLTGTSPSPETRAKLSTWQIGRKMSAKARANMSAAWVRRRLVRVLTLEMAA